MPFWVLIAIAVAMVAVQLLLMPKPKAPKPPSVDDLENPVAEAGKPIPVVFGTITVKGLNVLWYGDKDAYTFKVKV
jgi:predicted MFS family arabinose efflux permease